MSNRTRNRDLSDDTNLRIMQLVDNSMPNPERPRMSDKIEQELEIVERKAASLMAARENSGYKFKQAHKELMDEINLLRQAIGLKMKSHAGKNGSGDR